MLFVAPQIQIPLREIQFTFSRSGGPGGQNVNKVNSKATLRWRAAASPSLSEPIRQRLCQRYRGRLTAEGDLLITSQRFRDAGRNVADCLEKLRLLLLPLAAAPRPRRPSRPTRGSIERRLRAKRCRSQSKRGRRVGEEGA